MDEKTAEEAIGKSSESEKAGSLFKLHGSQLFGRDHFCPASLFGCDQKILYHGSDGAVYRYGKLWDYFS